MKRVLVFAVAILTVSSLFAQVHIKENATITPGQARKVQNVTIHRLRFVFSWDKGGYCCLLYVGASPCGIPPDSFQSFQDSIVISLSPGPAGYYFFDPQYCVASISPWEVANMAFSIYVDDTLFAQDSAHIAGSDDEVRGLWPNGELGIDFTTPFYSNFDFDLGTNQFLWWGMSTGMNLNGIDDCSGSTWSLTDPVTLTVVSGSQYVSFHMTDPQTGADEKLGSSIMTTGMDIGQYSLVADGVPADSNNCWVVVQAGSNGIIKTDSILIYPSVDHFIVNTVPDTINGSESTIIFVQAQDKYDQNINYYGSVRISDTPSEYGHLSSGISELVTGPKGKVGKQVTANALPDIRSTFKKPKTLGLIGRESTAEIDSILDMSYYYASLGYLSYIANGVVPVRNTTITFDVTADDNPSATGTGNVVIKGSGPNLNFPRYSQGYKEWADSEYDDYRMPKKDGSGDSIDAEGDTVCYKIRRMGCTLTDIAWSLSAYGYLINGNPINPLELNDWMNERAYDDGGYSPYADVNWKAIGILSGGNLTATPVPANGPFGNTDYAYDVSVLDNYLNNGDLVIAEVANVNPNTGKVDEHWVVVEPETNGQYPIMDPGYGDRTTMAAYDNNIWTYVVISNSNGK